jgi:hypothetical protein
MIPTPKPFGAPAGALLFQLFFGCFGFFLFFLFFFVFFLLTARKLTREAARLGPMKRPWRTQEQL